jgi:hypothetical protein
LVSTPHRGGASPHLLRETAQWFVFGGLVLLVSCNKPGFNAVSIRPIDGWVDGCNAIVIGGSGFGDDVTATIGGVAIVGASVPDKNSSDYGYEVLGYAPPSTIGKGYQDVVVTSDGKSDTITGSGAYYYKTCPMPGYIDSISWTDSLAASSTITLTGCSLDTTVVKARVIDSTSVQVGSDISLTSSCGTAIATFSAPSVPDPAGTYYLELVDGDGNVLNGTPCPPADTADTAGSSCIDYKLTYGAAQQ